MNIICNNRINSVPQTSPYFCRHAHKDTVWCVDVMQPEGLEPLVLSGGLDGSVIVWSMLRGDVLRTFDCGDSAVFSVKGYIPEYGPTQIISGTEDCLITLWCLESGEILRTIEGHSNHVMSLDVLMNYGGIINQEFDAKEQVKYFISLSLSA